MKAKELYIGAFAACWQQLQQRLECQQQLKQQWPIPRNDPDSQDNIHARRQQTMDRTLQL